MGLRAQFPVLADVAYLNAGTNGPLARAARAAAEAELVREERQGRAGMAHWERRQELAEGLRGDYAALLGCAASDVALTTCTTEGIGRVLLALELGRGDEIVTSDEEHPGVLGPLHALRARGAQIRVAPWAEVADAVGPRTTLVVCSHVGWRSGRCAPTALGQLDVPVLFDGAQGLGAVPVDVGALGADAYAAAGQKWLCGPEGMGVLHVSAALRERMRAPAPGYLNLAEPGESLDLVVHGDARAYDTPAQPVASFAHARAALSVLGASGWDALHAQATGLAARAADALRSRGRELLERDETTLVSWREPSGAEAAVERLAAAGVIVRSLPGDEHLRASFGGWSDDADLERLLAALPA